MALWFECKVRYDKLDENGVMKKVNEPYLVDALSFTEAEGRIIEELTPFISGDFTVSTAKKTKIAEILDINSDKFWLVRIAMITLDEKTGAEKKSVMQLLAGAVTFEAAVAMVKDHMKDTLSDWEIVGVNETAIVEVFPYKPIEMPKEDGNEA